MPSTTPSAMCGLIDWSASPPTPAEWINSSSICARLVTVNKQGRREVLELSIDRPLTIGRHPSCSYVVPDIVASGIHCKLYAVRPSNGGVLVSCSDLSTNGLLLNGHKIRKTSILLMDGDTIQIPHSQKFECIHTQKSPQKANIFDPTPPRNPSLKTKRIGRYLVTSHCLGSGSFATVHLAMDTSASRQAACKTIKRKSKDKVDKVMKEVDILLSLDHPNINRVWAARHDNNFVHIFLELCTGGDLFSYIVGHEDSRLCESEAKYIMFQLVKGLKPQARKYTSLHAGTLSSDPDRRLRVGSSKGLPRDLQRLRYSVIPPSRRHPGPRPQTPGLCWDAGRLLVSGGYHVHHARRWPPVRLRQAGRRVNLVLISTLGGFRPLPTWRSLADVCSKRPYGEEAHCPWRGRVSVVHMEFYP